MDTHASETIEIIDLCTPDVESHDAFAIPVDRQSVWGSTILSERFANIGRRLSILPMYPTSDTQNQDHSLLPNILRMYMISD